MYNSAADPGFPEGRQPEKRVRQPKYAKKLNENEENLKIGPRRSEMRRKYYYVNPYSIVCTRIVCTIERSK